MTPPLKQDGAALTDQQALEVGAETRVDVRADNVEASLSNLASCLVR
jgi:hypothetical protein